MKRFFQMYSGLRREIYILCFGRFVTAMGSLIWPMLTLILKSKLGFNAEEVALWFLIFGALQLPFGLAAGKLTDRFNKRNLIITFDLISVALYVLTSLLPLSTASLCVYYIGSLFQHMEWPAYDALIAESTTDHDREKAYSLQYLAANVGIVFAPMLGGLLFQNYLWLSFLICGLAVLTSTCLIARFIPKEMEKVKNTNTYEAQEEGTLLDMIKTRKILLLYIVIMCLSHMVYAQFNYMLPMQMDDMFHEQGAVFFGMLTSINAMVVIVFTPIFTKMTLQWSDLKRIFWGNLLQIIGISSCCFYKQQLSLYIISMIVFTLGEVLNTLGVNPYVSKRIPASHRGRFTSIRNICTTVATSVGNAIMGKAIVMYTFAAGWGVGMVMGVVLMTMLMMYTRLDKKRFSLLYK